jgi:iron complex transport system substrate-binding protein
MRSARGPRILALMAALLAYCVQSSAAEPPRRVASFNVCADQLVVALADSGQVVGLSPYARDPAISVVVEEARRFARLPLQAEAMIPLKPDLILVGTWDRPLTQRLLRSLGFRLAGIAPVNDIAAGLAQIREVAGLLGHRERGEAMVSMVEAARQKLAAAPRPKASTALLVGHQGYAVGPQSLAGALLAEAGLRPPTGAPRGYGGYVPLETLITLRPDYLVLSSLIDKADGQGALYLTHPALRALYPPERRIVLPSRFTLCAGPSLAQAFDYLAAVVARLAASN